jgi:hypothetical protein
VLSGRGLRAYATQAKIGLLAVLGDIAQQGKHRVEIDRLDEVVVESRFPDSALVVVTPPS